MLPFRAALLAGVASGGGAPTTDPNFSNVFLLVGADGADGSTAFDDESSKNYTLTANGNAQIDTAQAKFGSGSILLDGTGDSVSVVALANLAPLTGQFTVEAWVRFNVVKTNQSIISVWASALSGTSWAFVCSPTSLAFTYYDSGNTQRPTSGAWSPVTGQWYHLAADRDASDVLRVYADGVVIGSSTRAEVMKSAGTNPQIGALPGFSAYEFNGWIDEVRVTKNVARYGGAFTPPSAAFPRS